MQNGLRVSSPPRLPVANEVYTRQDQELFNNALRLYFNQLSGNVQSIAGVNGGRYVDCPNGLFFNTADQFFAATATAYPIAFNQTYLHNAVDLVSSTRATISISGIYNFQYSGQVLSTSANAKTIFIWIRRNGIDIGYSTRATTVTANAQYVKATWNFNIDMQAGDYLELMASVTDTDLHLEAETAAGAHPGIPSSVLTVNYISPLPDTLPTPP